jgi:hypothetical protein
LPKIPVTLAIAFAHLAQGLADWAKLFRRCIFSSS